ncbi:NUDIX hydrolase [Inconstantimicrobium mannanitabidum]|uniref:DNA mismatch repair protein MutT n=1 Tax=Inconstantimicrobium mannanitabidum TaxID=1604901 RepID=A0ACB5R827_9CLOT|nr:NUDIX hydrolase [Clostridium sp. TW13]GKX65343.1 DNA mismatch repair protein MutT [Clostridium sp. TW13]
MGYVKDLRAIIGTRPVNLVASTVIVTNHQNQILLQKRTEPYGSWGLPGGQIELGESTESAGKREVFEETGLIIDDLHLIDVFSGNADSHIQLKNGDEYYVVLVAYYTNNYKGTLKADGLETLECNFFSIDDIPTNTLKRHKDVIHRYLEIIKTYK